LWAGVAIMGTGLFWIMPGFDAVLSIPAIAGLILVISRLGYSRAALFSAGGVVIVALVVFATEGYLQAFYGIGTFGALVLAPGFAMGTASRGFQSAAKTVWYGLIPLLVVIAILLLFYNDIIKVIPGFLDDVNTELTSRIEASPTFSKMVESQFGPGDEGREKLIKSVDAMVVFLLKISPGVYIAGFMGIVMSSLLAAGSVAAKLGFMVPRFRPFYLWQASEWWLLPTAIGLILATFAGNDFWKFVGGNMLIVTGNVYAVCGLAVAEAFMRRLSLPAPIKIVTYLMLLLSVIVPPVLGLADSRFNFDREIPNTNEKNIE